MVITIIISTVSLVAVGCSSYFIYKKQINKKADLLIEKTKEANRVFDEMFVPTRYNTDEDIKEVYDKYAYLNHEANKFHENKHVTKDRKDALWEFILTYEDLDGHQQLYNRFAKECELVDREAGTALIDLSKLIQPDHYFAHSEKQQFLEKNKDLIEAILHLAEYKHLDNLKNKDKAITLNEKCGNLEETRNSHNQDFVRKELARNQSFFDTVLQYPLDPQQRESIVKLEDNCLVIASAGSGKTSTMMGKINYLTQRLDVEADQILTITYTRKAAGELSARLNNQYLRCLTFHALALDIIGTVTGAKPTIAGNDLFLNVFYEMIKTDSFRSAVLRYVEELQSGMRDAFCYDTAAEYFADRKKYGIQALYHDAEGGIIFTKSEEEKKICNYLTHLGVRFKYEEAYPVKTLTPDYRQYKPDFTIYYQDNDGKQRKVYLEHFAINEQGEVPRWFGDGQKGGWVQANRDYNQGIVWKKSLHRDNGTTLIYTTSDDFHKGKIKGKLKWLLEQAGVPVKNVSDSYLYAQTVDRNKSLEKSVMNMCQAFVFLMKANGRTIEWALEKAKGSERDTEVIKQIMKPISEAYESALKEKGEIDFTDAILMATELCNQGKWRSYEYILVDEFQDISIDRYKFLQALRGKGKLAKLYCVGDDWQSIYRFSGSDMSLFSQFSDYFGYTEECRIETTYRFNQPLIDISSEFIQSNPVQKKKKVKPLLVKNPEYEKWRTSPIGERTPKAPVEFIEKSKTEVGYVGFAADDTAYETLCAEMEKLPDNAPIYIIGRYTYDVNVLGTEHVRFDNANQKISVQVGNRLIPFMTIHASKGLEADYVFMLNCNSGNFGFPSQISDDPVLEYVLSKADSYQYAEERRVFYVGITRAKKKTIIMYNEKKPSTFVTELFDVNPPNVTSCPVCKVGYRVRVSGGVAKNGNAYTNWACSNLMAGCPYRERKFENTI